jgi:hypothetical protein
MALSALAALRIAFTSAWAVGSVVLHTSLCAQTTTVPFFTTHAPKGEFPAAMPSRVFAMA